MLGTAGGGFGVSGTGGFCGAGDFLRVNAGGLGDRASCSSCDTFGVNEDWGVSDVRVLTGFFGGEGRCGTSKGL